MASKIPLSQSQRKAWRDKASAEQQSKTEREAERLSRLSAENAQQGAQALAVIVRDCEDFEASLSKTLADTLMSKLPPLFSRFSKTTSRADVTEIASVLQAIDADAVEQLGTSVHPLLVAVAFAESLIDSNADLVSLFSSPSAFEFALAPAEELLRAARTSNIASAEQAIRALEQVMHTAASKPTRAATPYMRQSLAALAAGVRTVDRLNALAELDAATRAATPFERPQGVRIHG